LGQNVIADFRPFFKEVACFKNDCGVFHRSGCKSNHCSKPAISPAKKKLATKEFFYLK